MDIITTCTSFLTISSMSQRSLEVSPCCALWPELACSHQWFHGWLQLFLDYSRVVFGAKGKTRLTRLWICELSWKARGLVLMERGWTHRHPEWTHTHSTHTETSNQYETVFKWIVHPGLMFNSFSTHFTYRWRFWWHFLMYITVLEFCEMK